jgi:hypothetical protein
MGVPDFKQVISKRREKLSFSPGGEKKAGGFRRY